MELLDPKFFIVEDLLRSLGQRFPSCVEPNGHKFLQMKFSAGTKRQRPVPLCYLPL
jgi:hypothetical protein